ncbi:hypothetical protein [Marinactinospora rubrisoli]|uniref:Uncharacterized protein n=1 Tax=Marinactinospora rubrisoli TaxID=2715399 RepID=A0ABW2KF97_9ACTN
MSVSLRRILVAGLVAPAVALGAPAMGMVSANAATTADEPTVHHRHHHRHHHHHHYGHHGHHGHHGHYGHHGMHHGHHR